VPDIHFDSRANIIVTNAKLQASRVGVLNGLSYILEFVW
jgi:hypothetical protein